MLQRQSKGALPFELSYEDFVETFGRSKSIESDSQSELTEDSFESIEIVDNLSTSTGSFTTIIEDLPITEFDSVTNVNNRAEFNKETTKFEDYNTSELDMNFASCTSGSESKRRNSRLQTMANRLARKSFRAMKKKVNSDGPAFSYRGRSQFAASNSKWNSMFKRSRSTSRLAKEENQVQSNVTSAKHERNHELEVMTSSNPYKPVFVRSLSHSHAESACDSSCCTATKRHSVSNDNGDVKTKLNKKSEAMNYKSNKPYGTVGSRRPASRPTVLPLSAPASFPQPFSPEYDVIRKCDDFREEEHTRLVAIATLLKRRRNSLKIKCDQFDKELSQKNVEEDKARMVQSRLRQMRKKLEVVNQCIEEQQEEMKTTSAKIDLLLSLELYKLDLAREEKNGFSTSAKTSPLRSGSKFPFPISASCETLLSMDDPSVFDDTSSMTSMRKKVGSTQSSPARSNRRCSASSGIQNRRLFSRGVGYHADELVRKDTNRSQSIDNTVTSDCDSGFDNGDGLSRSDISLNRSFSKSTGSITSVSSHCHHPRSASCQESGSSSTGSCFFPAKPHSSSELSLFSPKCSIAASSTSNNSEKSIMVDPSVLAAIEDFEKFAEKTKRRLSLNGKLVPLKEGL